MSGRIRLANYWKLFSASVISNTGDGMGLIAYPWLASAVTRNPLLIGLVSVANRLPWLIFSLPAGVITDRVDRRVTMVICDILRAALTVVCRARRPRGTAAAFLASTTWTPCTPPGLASTSCS